MQTKAQMLIAYTSALCLIMFTYRHGVRFKQTKELGERTDALFAALVP